MIPACPPPRAPSRPKIPLPAGACDTHAHVFGSAARFPYAADRSYTPPDAPLEKYLAMLDTLGFARGVLVQGSAHGSDNSAMLVRWCASPAGCAASRPPARTCRRKSFAAGMRSASAGCGSTISSVAGSCIIAAAYRSTTRGCSRR